MSKHCLLSRRRASEHQFRWSCDFKMWEVTSLTWSLPQPQLSSKITNSWMSKYYFLSRIWFSDQNNITWNWRLRKYVQGTGGVGVAQPHLSHLSWYQGMSRCRVISTARNGNVAARFSHSSEHWKISKIEKPLQPWFSKSYLSWIFVDQWLLESHILSRAGPAIITFGIKYSEVSVAERTMQKG